MQTIKIQSKKLKEVINITARIEELLKIKPAKDGVIHLFLKHSTAALTTAYLAEKLDLDMIGAFEIMLPHTLTNAKGHHTHHISQMPAHIAASLLGPNLVLPVEKNKIKLGDFQSVAMIELNGPKERELIVDYQEQ